MKIVHLCLGSFFPDGYSYQENMLPKFHKQMVADVEVIASTQSFDKNGKVCYLSKTGTYFNEHGVRVTRLPYRWNNSMGRKLKRYVGVYRAIQEASPDILFIHGCQFMDSDKVVEYLKKHPNVVVYVDNHADFSNSATNWVSKNILHKVLWKHCAQKLEPYVKKFYGVLPVRVCFLTDVYGLPKEKCELLVMGADDEAVQKAADPKIREELRKRYQIAENDFLIVTGGKIDQWKTQTLLLMKAVKRIQRSNVKLIVFGSVTQELQSEVEALQDGKSVQYIGWMKSEQTYDYFASADLAVFPGRHSVFWEQVAGQGIPMIVKRWEGTDHVDLGGNVMFLEEDGVDQIQEKIEAILDIPEVYENMKQVAREKGMKAFSYKSIARRAVELQSL